MRRAAHFFTILLLSGCASFDPDLSDLDAGTGTSDGSTGAETGSSTGGTGGDSATSTSGPDMGSGETGSTDTGSTGTGGPNVCGDDMVGDDEECDGTDLAEMDCALVLGQMATGDLGCFDDCTFDVSSCSLDGPQPTDGLWSDCETQDDCTSQHPNLQCYTHNQKFCTWKCEDVSDCGPSPGGTATVVCDEFDWCQLDCSEGKTCPSGMGCYTGNGFSYCAG